MAQDVSGIEEWLSDQAKKKEARNQEVMKQYGMEKRSKILFASLNIELVANVIRNIHIGRTAEDGLNNQTFNENIKFLVKNELMGSEAQERFNAFRHIRNAFIHDLNCKSIEDLVLLVPDVKPLMLQLGENVLKGVPLPLVRTETEKLELGMNIITNSVIEECGRMAKAQAARRGLPWV